MYSMLRLTGWSALAAGGLHLLQFLVLGIGPALQEPAFPTPAESAATYWFGAVGMVTFTLIALAYVVFFSAATALTQSNRHDNTVWRTALQSVAVVGIAGWMLAGATNLARRGFNSAQIADAAGGDPVIGRAVLQGAYVVTSSAAIVGAIALGIWFVAFAIRALRCGVLGWPTGVAVMIIGAVLPISGWLANLGGVPTVIISFFVLAPVLLGRARRLRHGGGTHPSPAAVDVAQ
jgi:hypothetical protein